MHAGREFMERFWYHVENLVNTHISGLQQTVQQQGKDIADNSEKISRNRIGKIYI